MYIHNRQDGSPDTSHAGVGQSDSGCVQDPRLNPESVRPEVSFEQTHRMERILQTGGSFRIPHCSGDRHPHRKVSSHRQLSCTWKEHRVPCGAVRKWCVAGHWPQAVGMHVLISAWLNWGLPYLHALYLAQRYEVYK